MILALTGSAAALLNSSTYHSALGILSSTKGDETIRNEHSTLAQVKTSAQLSKARNVADLPFGAINVIFAGDFAQLPPVGGGSLYQRMVGTSVDTSHTLKGQQAAIGKALWHQVTAVVIL